jgi:hypothetical protein
VAGNDVICEVDVLMYVVLSKAEKRVSYGGSSLSLKIFDVISEMSYKMGSLLPGSSLCY